MNSALHMSYLHRTHVYHRVSVRNYLPKEACVCFVNSVNDCESTQYSEINSKHWLSVETGEVTLYQSNRTNRQKFRRAENDILATSSRKQVFTPFSASVDAIQCLMASIW